MKGQLFQIKNIFDEDLLLLWCSDTTITDEEVKKSVNYWFDNDENQDEENLIDILNKDFEYAGITFERVYFEELYI